MPGAVLRQQRQRYQPDELCHEQRAVQDRGVFLCCDDDVRESGSPGKAKPVYDFCAKYGWIPISMKNDWLTVFGEGVTKKDRLMD